MPQSIKHKLFVFSAVALCVAFLAVVRHIGAGNSQSIDPTKLNLINFSNGGYVVLDKKEPIAQRLIKKAYGPYAEWIMNNPVELSIPEETEFALPTFEEEGKFYALRESPTISMRLWQVEPPDVVLLGSSMFFMNFNRSTFYSQYPAKRLIDMTMGNNTPLLSEYILNSAEALGLKIKPGTVFLYGMNAVEFLDFYYPPFPHVKRAFALSLGIEPISKIIEIQLTHFFHVSVVKEIIDNWARAWVVNNKDLLSAVFRRMSKVVMPVSEAWAHDLKVLAGQGDPYAEFVNQSYRYSPYIPKELENKPTELAALLKRMAPPWDGKSYDNYKYGPDKVAAFKRLAKKIKAANARLILIKVPTSTIGYYRSPSSEYSFHKGIEPVVAETPVEYIDLTAWEKTGIDDRDFIYPRDELNPEHLNYGGSHKFTSHIITTILKPIWEQKGQK